MGPESWVLRGYRWVIAGAAVLVALLAASPGARAASRISEYRCNCEAVNDISLGVGGNVWFTSDHPSGVGFITPAGAVSNFGSDQGLDTGHPFIDTITPGPDGNMWFDQGDGSTPAKIGQVTPGGAITAFTVPEPAKYFSNGIVSGPQGDLWFITQGPTSGTGHVGSVTTSGTVSLQVKNNKFVGTPGSLVAGPGGVLYFAACSPAISVVRADGTIPITPDSPCSQGTTAERLTVDGNGNVWEAVPGSAEVTEASSNPSLDGKPIAYCLHGLTLPHAPSTGLVTGSDGNLWYAFTYLQGMSPRSGFGRITPPAAGAPHCAGDGTMLGTVTEFTQGLHVGTGGPLDPSSLISADPILGPDGNLWFSDGTCINNAKNGQGVYGWCAIGSITPSGQITEYPIDPSVAIASGTICGLPGCPTTPGKLVVGADGNIWYMETGTPGGIGRVVIGDGPPPGGNGPPPGGNVPPPGGNVPPPSGNVPQPAPVLSLVKQTHPTWKLGNLLAIFAKKPKKTSIPVGTTFSFTLNEAGSVTLTFTQLLDGRKVKGKCVAPTNKNAGKPHCQRQGPQSALTDSTAHAGANTVAFEGKLANSKKLKPGQYEVSIVATAGGKSSGPVVLKFTIAP